MNPFETVYPATESLLYPNCQSDNSAAQLQPYGILLVLAPDLMILQASANVPERLNISVSKLLDQPLSCLVDANQVQTVQQGISALADTAGSEARYGPFRLSLASGNWEGSIYRGEGLIFLELEPELAAEPVIDPALHYAGLQSAIRKIQQVETLQGFLQAAASEIRRLSGFDRVMIYRFDAEGAGEVIAEAKRDNLLPYLGLHYPASDIPAQPRQLYAAGLLRYIPDLQADNIALIPAVNPLTQALPDLSFVTLRGTDPCCVEYHCNMDVAALMVIALVKEQKLWGLISCHHQTPKLVPCTVRSVCGLLGQLISAELANKVSHEELDYIVRLKSLQSEFVESISQANDLRAALVYPAPRILDLVSAQGVAVCLEDEITLIGATPTLEQIRQLIQWVDQQTQAGEVFHTNTLPKLYAEAEAYKDIASGLLLLRISQVRRYYILWFRPEVLQTIHWAGDPNASLQTNAAGEMLLSPRHSFAEWQETVRLTALPWRPSEIENALDLRNAIVGIVLNKADELAQMNQALERSIQELESFAYAASHDLKEPLRGIHNYATFLVEDYADQLDEAGIDRLQILVKLTQRMESLIDVLLKFSQIGQTSVNRQPTDLNELVQQVVNVFRYSDPDALIEVRIPRPLPMVQVDPVLVNEIFSNLLGNASKYNDKPDPWVEVGYLDPDDPLSAGFGIEPGTTVLYIRDNGIGIRERHLDTIFRLFKRLHPQTMYGGGTGAGLTIAKKIVEQHGGQIWVRSEYGQGSTFYLTLE